MKRLFFLLLLTLPFAAMAQRELTIEGPSDKVASVTFMVDSEFDQNTGRMTLTLTGFESDNANAVWLLKDTTEYKNLKKIFRKAKGSLKRSSYSRKQISFLNLKDKTALTSIGVTGAELLDCSVQTNASPKYPIQKQILPLDSHSKVVLKLKVNDDADKVTLDVKNPCLLVKMHKNKKCKKHYKLTFIGSDESVDFDIAREYCERNAHLLVQLKEYDSIFGKCEDMMKEMKDSQNSSLADVKSVAMKELAQIKMERFENTRCQEIDDALAVFKALKRRIENFEVKQPNAGGGGGAGGGAGRGDAPAVEDCNYKKVSDDLRTAVVKMNTYANDWISATDPAVKKAKKLAFDSLVKDTDAKINALSASCRKKLDANALKNYQAAKKLITNYKP